MLQLLSESELIDELSEDFDRAKHKEKQSKPTEKTEVCFWKCESLVLRDFYVFLILNSVKSKLF